MHKLADKITVNPNICFGKPVIAGTRVPVDLVVGQMGSGMDTKEVMAEYELTKDQVLAALKYAASIISSENILYA